MMTLITVTLAAGTLLAMAVMMSFVLGWANKAFHVEVDPRVEAVLKALPGANCGSCGYIGCGEYAEAVATGEAVNKCTVGGDSCMAALAQIMGVEAGRTLPYRPVVHCGATYDDRLQRNQYLGMQTCTAANLVADVQGCTYGCLGFGDCAGACEFDAIHVLDGLAVVDYGKCVGCGACAKVCPRNIITMTPFKTERVLAVSCSNKDSGKEVKQVCNVGCIGCRACARFCSLINIEDNLSTLNYEEYSSECMIDLEKACEKCPSKSLIFVGKPTEKDKEAVAEQKTPTVIEPKFKSTVDDTRWWG